MFIRRSFLVITIVIVIGLLSAFAVTVRASSGTPLTLYAGEVSSSTYGFGNTASTITSPGPPLTLVEGTTYTMTVYNVGTMVHAWEIVSTKAASTSPLFGAGIDLTSYIAPGSSGSFTFTPNKTGNFYYVCPVPGHIALGMWGTVVVSSATSSPSPTIPEFPSALILMFIALAITAPVALLARQKTKTKHFIKI